MRKFKVEGFKAGLQEESYGNYRKPEFMLDSSHLAIGRFAALNLIREETPNSLIKETARRERHRHWQTWSRYDLAGLPRP
jgi:hypothetical protein